VGPASASFPWEFLETFLQSGVLEYIDGVTVHPYRDKTKPPETAAADFEKLRQMIDHYGPASKKKPLPILSGEWGYSTYEKGVSLEQQAEFAVRQQLSNLLNGVPLSIWYDWKNDGPDPKDNEHNFGTVFPDLKPKPVYEAIQKLTRELAGYRIARRIPLESDKDYLLACTNGVGAQKLISWTSDKSHTISVSNGLLGVKSVTVRAKTGPNSVQPRLDSLGLELLSEPQYIQWLSPAP
jgi:hypothetical protein